MIPPSPPRAGAYGVLGFVLVPHSGQNFEPAGMAAEQAAHFTVAVTGLVAPRFGSRRTSTMAMIHTPTIKRIHVTKPMRPKIKSIERKPPRPESSPENGLLELLPPPPLFPLPLFDDVTSTFCVLLVEEF